MTQIPVAEVVTEKSSRNRGLYVLLAVCLGWLGIHNFYAGRILPAIAQLAISIAGAALVFPVAIIWLWAIIDAVRIKTDGTGATMRLL
jgi:TM2 domain-containing membrane protein YozV